MTNNFLYPQSLADIAGGMIDRAGVELPRRLRETLVRKLITHFHESEHDVVTATLPPDAPDWARAKTVHHLLPGQEIQRQTQTVVEALECAHRLSASGCLKPRESQLDAEVRATLVGLGHMSWAEIHLRCWRQGAEANEWELAQIEAYSQRRVAGLEGRIWRRLRSVQEVWDASRGTQWCLRKKGEFVLDAWQSQFRTNELELWVLEAGATPLVLLSIEPNSRGILEIKDADNAIARRYRADVQRLCAAMSLTVAPWSQGRDVLALALDERLGLPGQSARRGQISSRGSSGSICFKLWADGRRGRYLVGFCDPLDGAPDRYLRLDTRANDWGHRWALTGSTPAAWRGTPYELMRRVLTAVSSGPLPRHVRRALRKLRAEARMPPMSQFLR